MSEPLEKDPLVVINVLEVEVARLRGARASMREARDAWKATAAKEAERIHELEAVLREIEKGEGPYNRDRLTHAENTIEAMKKLARAALAGESPVQEPRWEESQRVNNPDACWRIVNEDNGVAGRLDYTCILERGHDDGIHEPAQEPKASDA